MSKRIHLPPPTKYGGLVSGPPKTAGPNKAVQSKREPGPPLMAGTTAHKVGSHNPGSGGQAVLRKAFPSAPGGLSGQARVSSIIQRSSMSDDSFEDSDDEQGALVRELADEFIERKSAPPAEWYEKVEKLKDKWRLNLDNRIWTQQLLVSGPLQVRSRAPGPPPLAHDGSYTTSQTPDEREERKSSTTAFRAPQQVARPAVVHVPVSAAPEGVDPNDDRAREARQARKTANDWTATCYGCVTTRKGGVTKVTKGKSAGSCSTNLHAERVACLNMAASYGITGISQTDGAALGLALAREGVEILSIYTDFPPCSGGSTSCDLWVKQIGAQAVIYSEELGAWNPAASSTKKKAWVEGHCEACGMEKK